LNSSVPLVTIEKLSIGFKGPALLDEVDCRIFQGESIGLLGRNGAGKTTFMRLLCGQETPDSGRIDLRSDARLALLPQDVPEDIHGTVESVVSASFPADWSEPENHWRAEQRLEQTLVPMQLDPNADFRSLSTGMQRRVLLARAIASSPDILLLDEPTNHLDIESILWLEKFLSNLTCTLIFVTHDRRFLTVLAKRILEVDRGRLFDWSCDYQTFLKRKEEALAAEDKQNALFDKKLAQEEAWIRQGIKARRTRNEGRVRALKALREVRQQRQEKVGSVNLQMDSGQRSGALVLKCEDASFGYNGEPIVRHATTTIMRGDKIGIIGPNGAGKSTLLKGLLGKLDALTGSVRHGTNLDIAYFDQTRETLDETQTAEQNVGDGKTSLQIGDRTKHVIGYLQDFLFSPEQARSQIKFFSGGQRNRLLLAKLFAKSANLLVLDEPTNDLDSETLELLESQLVDYKGTVLLISHDREFLNNVVSSTLVFEEGAVNEYVGGYDDWQSQSKSSRELKERMDQAATEEAAKSKSSEKTKPIPSKKKLSFKEQRELDELPTEIEKLETAQAELHAEMGTEDFYKSAGDKIAEANRKLSDLTARLAVAYARWEELEH
jgi:ATP-binding cassette subfamily F protein uup